MRSFKRNIASIVIGLTLGMIGLHYIRLRIKAPHATDDGSSMITRRQFYTEAESKQNIEAWPRITAAGDPPGVRPKIRELPRPDFQLTAANANGEITDSDTVRSLFRRTHLALERCPEPALRRDLVSLLFSGKMHLAFRRRPMEAGSYRPHEVYDKPTDLIVFDPDRIMQMYDRLSLFDFYLTAYHELSHYRTHLAGGDKSIRKGLLTAEGCTERWQTEHTAYAEMCELSRRWNYPSEREFCETKLDGPSFNQRLLARLTTGASEKNPDNRLACAFVWAKLAGHPHPDMFF